MIFLVRTKESYSVVYNVCKYLPKPRESMNDIRWGHEEMSMNEYNMNFMEKSHNLILFILIKSESDIRKFFCFGRIVLIKLKIEKGFFFYNE